MIYKHETYLTQQDLQVLMGFERHGTNLQNYIHNGLIPYPDTKIDTKYYYSPTQFAALQSLVEAFKIVNDAKIALKKKKKRRT